MHKVVEIEVEKEGMPKVLLPCIPGNCFVCMWEDKTGIMVEVMVMLLVVMLLVVVEPLM